MGRTRSKRSLRPLPPMGRDGNSSAAASASRYRSKAITIHTNRAGCSALPRRALKKLPAVKKPAPSRPSAAPWAADGAKKRAIAPRQRPNQPALLPRNACRAMAFIAVQKGPATAPPRAPPKRASHRFSSTTPRLAPRARGRKPAQVSRLAPKIAPRWSYSTSKYRPGPFLGGRPSSSGRKKRFSPNRSMGRVTLLSTAAYTPGG